MKRKFSKNGGKGNKKEKVGVSLSQFLQISQGRKLRRNFTRELILTKKPARFKKRERKGGLYSKNTNQIVDKVSGTKLKKVSSRPPR